MSRKQNVARRTIPLCGIVLVLGMLAYGRASFDTAGADPEGTPRAASNAEKQELITLIQNFLSDVPKNERSTFDRFFADDIIYTRGTGQVIAKKDILADTGNSTAPPANATYEGQDFQVHRYGNFAVVNFRLVMHATENDKTNDAHVPQYRNVHEEQRSMAGSRLAGDADCCKISRCEYVGPVPANG